MCKGCFGWPCVLSSTRIFSADTQLSCCVPIGCMLARGSSIAGPGKAWSALEQGQYLFELAERKPNFIKVPVALMDGIIGVLDFLAKIFPGLEVRPQIRRGSAWYSQGGCTGKRGRCIVELRASMQLRDAGAPTVLLIIAEDTLQQSDSS
jgi:hypothetical protein